MLTTLLAVAGWSVYDSTTEDLLRSYPTPSALEAFSKPEEE